MNTESRDRLVEQSLNIPGWANRDILNALGWHAAQVEDNGVILEIGGLFGRSSYMIGNSKKPSVKLITIDKWPTMVNHTFHDGKCGADQLALLNSKIVDNYITTEDFFSLWNEFTKDIENKISMKIPAAAPNDNFPMIDFIYHDAGHEYEEVYSDLVHWFPKLKQNGILIVDDYDATTFPGVIQAVDQFAIEYNLQTQMITNRNILLRRKL
jgi:predicted O-methyltransferase YrrM